jgi:hypothetical protein
MTDDIEQVPERWTYLGRARDPKRAPRRDKCAFNARARPKALLNTHGVVESIKGGKATVRLDEGDRQRLIRATGKEYSASAPAPIGILDKVQDSQ